MRMIRFEAAELSESERALQAEVRRFLAAELPRGSFEPGLGIHAAKDPGFSKRFGETAPPGAWRAAIVSR
jgi:hypothetical protein